MEHNTGKALTADMINIIILPWIKTYYNTCISDFHIPLGYSRLVKLEDIMDQTIGSYCVKYETLIKVTPHIRSWSGRAHRHC